MKPTYVMIVFAKTNEPLRDPHGQPIKMIELDALLWLNRHGWKHNGRAIIPIDAPEEQENQQ